VHCVKVRSSVKVVADVLVWEGACEGGCSCVRAEIVSGWRLCVKVAADVMEQLFMLVVQVGIRW